MKENKTKVRYKKYILDFLLSTQNFDNFVSLYTDGRATKPGIGSDETSPTPADRKKLERFDRFSS